MTTESIKAIVVDPKERTIRHVSLPTRPGNPERYYGTQVDIDALYETIGCRSIEIVALDKENQITVDGNSLLADVPPQHFWQWGEKCQPIAGIGIITGHDWKTDTWLDTSLSIDEVRKAVRFTKRIVRRMEVETFEPGAPVNLRVKLVAPIVDEC